jgi:hypothetical protein
MALSHVMNVISNAGIVGAGTGSGGGGGGGSNLDSQTVTVGTASAATGGSGAPTGTTTRRGYSGIYAFGSVSDGTSNLYSGAAFSEIQYSWDTYYPISAVTLRIVGNGLANSGWTTLTIGTTAYQRSSASYSATYAGQNITTWYWYSGSDNTGAANPFAATGQTTTCVFT